MREAFPPLGGTAYHREVVSDFLHAAADNSSVHLGEIVTDRPEVVAQAEAWSNSMPWAKSSHRPAGTARASGASSHSSRAGKGGERVSHPVGFRNRSVRVFAAAQATAPDRGTRITAVRTAGWARHGLPSDA